MARTAVLIDLDFFLHRYRTLRVLPGESHDVRTVARALHQTAIAHTLPRRNRRRNHSHDRQNELYRILIYDCKPLTKKAHNPVDGRAIDFSRTEQAKFRNALHQELVRMRKVALRLGELMDSAHWIIKPEPMQRLLSRKITTDQLRPEDVSYYASQKGVDIKFGIDIATLAYKRLVDCVVLITGDSDFVPAAKLARREGLDVILDPLWNPISPSLHEHIDGLRTVWPKRSSDRINPSRNGIDLDAVAPENIDLLPVFSTSRR